MYVRVACMFLQDNWFKNGKQDTLVNNKINLAYLWATETVQKSAPLVRIGLTDLPKTGGAIVAPTVPTALHWLCNRSCNHNQINQHLLLMLFSDICSTIFFNLLLLLKSKCKNVFASIFLICECRDACQQISPSVDPTFSLSYVSNSAQWRILPWFVFSAGL